MNSLFDIVIPFGPHDESIINEMIKYTKENIICYRNIYIISYNPNISIADCITIDENIFPFNKPSIAAIIGNSNRLGWYLQQLLKLYAGSIINNILNNYLVIDSDTFFLKKKVFFNNNLSFYSYGHEYHSPYFDHMLKLHPSLTKQINNSGVCHHMMFQQDILLSLFKMVENHHNEKFYNVFLHSISDNERTQSGASEYEIYYTYLHIYHKERFLIRELNWKNVTNLSNNENLDFISYHWYTRE